MSCFAPAPDSVDKIADAVRRLHAGPAFVSDFDMFRIQPSYRAICQARDFRIPDTYDDYQPLLARIEAAMAVRGHDLVPCNNDLLAANYIDDGERFWIVDYEYSGMNDPCFELGNTCAESKLSQDQLERLVELSFRRPAPQPGRAGESLGRCRQLRLDALGLHPAGGLRHRLRLLGLGCRRQVRARGRGLRRPGDQRLARRRDPQRLSRDRSGALAPTLPRAQGPDAR